MLLAKLPASAIAMLVVAGGVLYGGLAICLILSAKRKM
ncbi:MAG: MetS family NSS transporter small subunit [bacterium]